MRISDVKISLRDDEKLKAFATVTFEDCFVVRGMKVIQAARGLFVAMPARRKPDGTFQDVAHPIHVAARADLERQVLEAYRKAIAAGQGMDPGDDAGPDGEANGV
jgi:stage V sporulation protein G